MGPNEVTGLDVSDSDSALAVTAVYTMFSLVTGSSSGG